MLKDYHIGRSWWPQHFLEDACPCPKAPCGLVVSDTVDPACEQHGQTPRTLREMHTPDECPALEPEGNLAGFLREYLRGSNMLLSSGALAKAVLGHLRGGGWRPEKETVENLIAMFEELRGAADEEFEKTDSSEAMHALESCSYAIDVLRGTL